MRKWYVQDVACFLARWFGYFLNHRSNCDLIKVGSEFHEQVFTCDDFPVPGNPFPPDNLILINNTDFKQQFVALPTLADNLPDRNSPIRVPSRVHSRIGIQAHGILGIPIAEFGRVATNVHDLAELCLAGD